MAKCWAARPANGIDDGIYWISKLFVIKEQSVKFTVVLIARYVERMLAT